MREVRLTALMVQALNQALLQIIGHTSSITDVRDIMTALSFRARLSPHILGGVILITATIGTSVQHLTRQPLTPYSLAVINIPFQEIIRLQFFSCHMVSPLILVRTQTNLQKIRTRYSITLVSTTSQIGENVYLLIQAKLENTNIQLELQASIIGQRNSLLFTYLTIGLVYRIRKQNSQQEFPLYFFYNNI